MSVYLFYELSLHDENRVVSVYDDPEVTIYHKLYILSEGATETRLAVHIMKTFPFKCSGKSLMDLGIEVIDQIRVYELERNIESEDIQEFYERMHLQDFMDGINNPWKYEEVMSLDEIIITAVKLGIISKDKIMKYLLTSSGDWSYHLSRENAETI
jgi:hypothetical protein